MRRIVIVLLVVVPVLAILSSCALRKPVEGEIPFLTLSATVPDSETASGETQSIRVTRNETIDGRILQIDAKVTLPDWNTMATIQLGPDAEKESRLVEDWILSKYPETKPVRSAYQTDWMVKDGEEILESLTVDTNNVTVNYLNVTNDINSDSIEKDDIMSWIPHYITELRPPMLEITADEAAKESSTILEQYLAWLEQRQKMDLEVASEFVTMASQLVYIKTRMLLSIEDEEAQSEMDALIQSLEERRRNENYVRVKAMAARLAPMGEFGRNIVTRNPEPMERGKIYEYDQEKSDLILAMAEIRNRSERTLPPPRTAFQDIVQHEPYPVESKAREIIQRLREHGITRFLLLFRGNRSRSEMVATFLAVLELCRAHVLHLAGSETDCTVRQEGELPENLTL